jgi:hypothetical protein
MIGKEGLSTMENSLELAAIAFLMLNDSTVASLEEPPVRLDE